MVKKIDIGKWIFCCCRCYMHVHVCKCECDYYVRLHWSVYNHVKRTEWKFSSIDSSENTWKIQSVKPFMLCYAKLREIYIHTNYVKMFQMRFHKQSSSIWLRVSNDNAQNLCVRIKCRHEFKCSATYHIHIMCHYVAMTLIKKNPNVLFDIFKLQLFVHVCSDGAIVLIERIRNSKNKHVYNETLCWISCLFVCVRAFNCVCVCVRVFLVIDCGKRHSNECIQCKRKFLCDIDWVRANKPINWLTDCLNVLDCIV